MVVLSKLPEEKLKEIEVLGDYWENQVVPERVFPRVEKNLV